MTIVAELIITEEPMAITGNLTPLALLMLVVCILVLLTSYCKRATVEVMVSPFAVSPSVASDATDSICPKGWEMARYDEEKSYKKLIETTMGITEWRTLKYSYIDYSLLLRPFSFTRSGIYNYKSSIGHRSFSGLYWESGKESKSQAYYLYYAIDLLHINTKMDLGHGISVRCVAKLIDDI